MKWLAKLRGPTHTVAACERKAIAMAGRQAATGSAQDRFKLRSQVNQEVALRKTVFYTFAFLLIFLLGYTIIYGDMGLLKYYEVKALNESLKAEVYSLNVANTKLRDKNMRLRRDDFELERHLREQYNMQRPGEKVYIYE